MDAFFHIVIYNGEVSHPFPPLQYQGCIQDFFIGGGGGGGSGGMLPQKIFLYSMLDSDTI